MENDRITKRVYGGMCACSCSVGMPQKMWIYTVKDCLKKTGLNVRQAGRMVHDECMVGIFVGDHPGE